LRKGDGGGGSRDIAAAKAAKPDIVEEWTRDGIAAK
jgi:hypothetical protein